MAEEFQNAAEQENMQFLKVDKSFDEIRRSI